MGQTYERSLYEIIVVADGRQRDVQEMIAEFARRPDAPTLQYLEVPHRGPNAARNSGIAVAKGTLLCLIDDDVEAPRAWLEAMVAGIETRDGLICFGGPIRSRFEAAVPRTCRNCSIRTTTLDEGDLVHEVDAVYSANMAVSRWVFERIGPFDESLPIYGDEEEWQHRLRLAGGAVVYLPEASVWHRQTEDDLRLRPLVRRHLRYGYGEAAYWIATGRSGLGHEALERAGSIPRLVGHAVRRGCWNGVLASCAHLAFGAGAVARRSRVPIERLTQPDSSNARTL